MIGPLLFKLIYSKFIEECGRFLFLTEYLSQIQVQKVGCQVRDNNRST